MTALARLAGPGMSGRSLTLREMFVQASARKRAGRRAVVG
jgi:hypothetical protein